MFAVSADNSTCVNRTLQWRWLETQKFSDASVIDLQKKETARASMRKMVKHLLKKYKYPSLSGRRWGCTPGHITVHPVVPDVKVGAGGGIRALGVDHELVRKGVFVQPGCGGQVVRPAFPIPGQAVRRALGKGEIFFGFAWHSVPPFNLVVNKKASGLLRSLAYGIKTGFSIA